MTLEFARRLTDPTESFVSVRSDQTEYLDELLCRGAKNSVGRERRNLPQRVPREVTPRGQSVGGQDLPEEN